MAKLDLLTLLGNAAQALQENQSALNQADSWNGDHGDNMVEIFTLAKQAIQKHSGASPAEQLTAASQALVASKSGSAQLYSEGFAQAAETIQDREITPDNLVPLVQSLLGAGGQPTQESNPLAGLLGGLLGEDSSRQDDTLDFGDVLSAGFSFVQSKNKGQNTISSLVSAIMGTSPNAQSPHRSQSGELVATSLLDSLLDK